jgi:hypothetical protein
MPQLFAICVVLTSGLLQGLCTICTDFIISELWTSNFLQYQVSSLAYVGDLFVLCSLSVVLFFPFFSLSLVLFSSHCF